MIIMYSILTIIFTIDLYESYNKERNEHLLPISNLK